MFNYEGYAKYRAQLNENGLFPSEEAAQVFKDDYFAGIKAGIVGDGMVDLYICKVYKVDIDKLFG